MRLIHEMQNFLQNILLKMSESSCCGGSLLVCRPKVRMLLASEVTKTMLYGVFARSDRSARANSWMAESEVSGICPCA